MNKMGKRSRSVRVMALSGIIVVILTGCLIFLYTVTNYYRIHDKTNSELVSSLNYQMALNTQTYFNKLEDAGNMVFLQKEYIAYTDNGHDSYESLQLEKEMTEFFEEMSLMDNYCDFGIVYSSNCTVGKISDGTKDCFEGELYSSFMKALGDNKTCWCTIGDGTRIYYLKYVNESGVFVGSFYTTEFSKMILSGEKLKNTSVIITDAQEKPVCQLGKGFDDYSHDILENTRPENSYTIVHKDHITSVNVLECGWKIISVYDLSIQVLAYKRCIMASVIIMIAGVFVIGFLLLIITPELDESGNSNKRVNMVDSLTGLRVPEATENDIAEKIDTCISGSTLMLAFVSIKNYNLIYENYGSAGINEAVLCVAQAIKDNFGDNAIIGKLSENKFGIFMDFTEFDLFKVRDKIKESLKFLEVRLKECELSSGRGMIKCAVGATVYPDAGDDYDVLCECAQTALHRSLADETGKYCLYIPKINFNSDDSNSRKEETV